MMGDVFLQERQDTVIDSDNIVIIIVAAAAFIGQLIAVFIGMEHVYFLSSIGFPSTSIKSA